MSIFDYDGVEWYQSIGEIQQRIEEILNNPVSATRKEEKLLNQLYKEVNRDSSSVSISRSKSLSKSKTKSKSYRKNRNKINRTKKTRKNRSKN
jgi:hypothetical protein